MRPSTTEAQRQLWDWLERAQEELVPEPIVVAKTIITHADDSTASIRVELAGTFDERAAELCAKTAVQAFALTTVNKTATIGDAYCNILERPKGKTLWAEAIVIDRRMAPPMRCAVDIIDERDCRVGAGVVSFSVEGERFT
jgi:hypothetical protein